MKLLAIVTFSLVEAFAVILNALLNKLLHSNSSHALL